MTVPRAVTLISVALLIGCQQSLPPQNEVATETPQVSDAEVSDAVRQKAVAAKDALFERLSARLAEVIGKDGPAAAIDVCSTEAAKIAVDVAREQGVEIGRTSFKLRNSKNVPPEWAEPFVEQRLSESRFVALPNGRSGALLPIKLKKACLTCHGPADTIAADVKSKLAELYPTDDATGFSEGDLRGWFWIEVPAGLPDETAAVDEPKPIAGQAAQGHGMMGRGRGMGGRGMGGGRGPGMREDMTTIHAMFDSRDKIIRTVKNLPNGAATLTESDDAGIASLIQEHVPAMEGRVEANNPLPPMTFHPLFIELIKNADKVELNYETTERGVKVTYTSDDPHVVHVIQEHAQLVSRFIRNGMEEIHKPYTIPEPAAADLDAVR